MLCFALIGSAYRRYQTVLLVGVYGDSNLWGLGYIWIGDWLVLGVGVPGLKKSQVLIWTGKGELCFAKNTLLSSDSSPLRYFFLMPGVISSDIQGFRLTSAAVPLSNCLVQGRGIYFSLLILPFPIYIYLSTVLRSFYLGVLILLFFFTRFSKSLWIRTCNA